MSKKCIALVCSYFFLFSCYGLNENCNQMKNKVVQDSIINLFNKIDSSSLNIKSREPKFSYKYNEIGLLSGASCQGFFISTHVFLYYKILELYNPAFNMINNYLFNKEKNIYLCDLYGYICDNGTVLDKPKEYKTINEEMIKRLYYSYKSWISLLKKKGIKFLRKSSISPLFKTNIIITDSSSIYNGLKELR